VRRLPSLSIVVLMFVLAACGGSKQAATTTTATTAPAPAVSNAAAPTSPAATQTTPGALPGEARSAAAGDIPDNQVFVTYAGPAFSMKMPEGWARTGNGNHVTFRDKNNIVRVVVVPGSGAPSVTAMKRELSGLSNAHITSPPTTLTIGGRPAVKAVYTTKSAPNAVTGKTVTLTVDRYELAGNGKRAVVDLGSPVGVDNVDAYRMMIQSFRLR
jgi:hypothetical protein